MTRPTKSRILFGIVVAVHLGIAGALSWALSFQPKVIFLYAIILIIPGRITSFFWRDFYAGQQQMQAGLYGQAQEKFEHFLSKVRTNPWLKKLIYFKWGIYTWDIEALTLNNLGYIAIEMNDLLNATKHFENALILDPLFPMPYANLAILSYVNGDEDRSAELLNRACELGYTKMTEASLRQEAIDIRARANSI